MTSLPASFVTSEAFRATTDHPSLSLRSGDREGVIMADTTKVLDMINNASQMVKDAVEKVN